MQRGHLMKTIIMRIKFIEQIYSRFHQRVTSLLTSIFRSFSMDRSNFLTIIKIKIQIRKYQFLMISTFQPIIPFISYGNWLKYLFEFANTLWKRLYMEWLLLLRLVGIRASLCAYEHSYTMSALVCVWCECSRSQLQISFQWCVNNSAVHFALLYFRTVF